MSSRRRMTSARTVRRAITGRRHVDVVPTVTELGMAMHRLERAEALGAQRYQTGPRHGQELADARKAGRS